MPFTANCLLMEHFCHRLSGLGNPSPLQHLVRDTLQAICRQSVFFDKYISKDTPFFAEFFFTLHAGDLHEDSCFALTECLIIFCREKYLLTRGQELTVPERRLLTEYENSEQWSDPELQSLLAQWYWVTLPQRHSQLSADSPAPQIHSAKV